MDNKGENNKEHGKGQSFLSGKSLNPIDYFQKDEGFVFVYKKTEKLATALYMVTNLFGDSEPMKWTLRAKVSHLLSFVIGFKDVLQSREDEFVNEIKTRVLEIVSLIEIASRSGLVSSMNFSVLRGEFMYLINFLTTFKKASEHMYATDLKENFFDVQQVQNTYVKKPDVAVEHARVLPNVLDVPKRTNRQNIIVGLLKKKSELTINDIAETISDCSEKTIQRELISLIEMGVVQKIGERRWSRYSLVV